MSRRVVCDKIKRCCILLPILSHILLRILCFVVMIRVYVRLCMRLCVLGSPLDWLGCFRKTIWVLWSVRNETSAHVSDSIPPSGGHCHEGAILIAAHIPCGREEFRARWLIYAKACSLQP